MPLLGLITTKIICVFYGIGNILCAFLIINKTEIWALTHKKMWWMLLGWFQFLHLFVMLFPWFWHPWDGSWVHLLSPPLIMWAAHHPSSELLPRLSEHRQLPWTPEGNSGVNRQTKPNADLNFIFPPTKLVQQHGKSLQIPWTSLGREQLTGMQDQAVLPCDFSSGLFLGLCVSCPCLWKDCLWCEAALWAGLHVPFFTNLLPHLG